MSNTLFGTDGVRGTVNKFPMLPEIAMRIGLAAGSYFRSEERRHRVVIGKDTRLSGYIFENALTAGLCASGMDVFQVGPLPTPAIAFLTRNMRADFGIVISASHNPFSDNGIKLFDKNGFKLEDDVEDAIAEMVLNPKHEWSYPESSEVGRAFKINDAPGRYIVSIKNSFPAHLTLDGLRVVIDCAHGANYKVAPMALHELGADVVAIGIEPNGTNINHLSGSLYPEVVAEKVRETRADIGLALDGDADRLIVVDELGNTLDGDQIMAICAHDMIKKNALKGNTVVSTVMSNMALEVFLRDNGVNLIRTDVGDRHVVAAMRKSGAILGGEQSGHLIFMEHGTTGDGLLAGLQLLRIMKEQDKPISQLADILHRYPQKLISFPVGSQPPFDSIPELTEALKQAESELAGKGRVLLRYSGTEAKCRVMVEGKDEHKVKKIATTIVDLIKKKLQ